MRLTIATQTGTVGKDGDFFNGLDLSQCGIPSGVWALQWQDTQGHIEYDTTIPNDPITELPDWANNCLTVWNQAEYERNNPPPPTPAENKLRAESLLDQSDWTQLPDVPLQNKQEWATYREALRQIAINPTDSPVWPTEPQNVWITNA